MIPFGVLSNAVCGLAIAIPARASFQRWPVSARSARIRFTSRKSTGWWLTISDACSWMASAAVPGVTVRQVINRWTGAAGSPQSKPTLSHDSARCAGANCSSQPATSETVVIVLSLPIRARAGSRSRVVPSRAPEPAGLDRRAGRSVAYPEPSWSGMLRRPSSSNSSGTGLSTTASPADCVIQHDAPHDAGQERAVRARSDQPAVLDEEDVGPRPLADQPVGRDAKDFVASLPQRLAIAIRLRQ